MSSRYHLFISKLLADIKHFVEAKHFCKYQITLNKCHRYQTFCINEKTNRSDNLRKIRVYFPWIQDKKVFYFLQWASCSWGFTRNIWYVRQRTLQELQLFLPKDDDISNFCLNFSISIYYKILFYIFNFSIKTVIFEGIYCHMITYVSLQ